MRTWSLDQRLTHAVALCETDAELGRMKLRELHEAHPQHKRVRFAYAAALLDENDEERDPQSPATPRSKNPQLGVTKSRLHGRWWVTILGAGPRPRNRR